MRLTKQQKEYQRRIAHEDAAARNKDFNPDYSKQIARRAKKKGRNACDLNDIAEARDESDQLTREFDQRANEALRSAVDPETGLVKPDRSNYLEDAKDWTEAADKAAASGTGKITRSNQFRTAHRAAAKLSARNTATESRIYNKDSSNSWFGDVALMRTGEMNGYGNLDSRSLGLYDWQSTGRDVQVRGPRNEAASRLAAYSHELRDNIVAETEFGNKAVAHFRSRLRYSGYVQEIDMPEQRLRKELDDMLEQRDSLTTIGDLAYFVPPDYISELFNLYRSFAAPLLNAAGRAPLPATGFQVMIPTFSTYVGVQATAEGVGGWFPLLAYATGSSVTRFVAGNAYLFAVTSPGTSGSTEPNWSAHLTVGDTVTDSGVTWTNTARPAFTVTGSGAASAPGGDTSYFADISTYVGQATVAQQFIDRGALTGAFDQAIVKQIARETATKLDNDLLYAVLNNGNIGAVTGDGDTLYKVADFLTDLSSAAATVNVEGVNLQPTDIFAVSAVVRGFLKQVDSTGAPIFQFDPNAKVAPDGVTEGYSGYNIQGANFNYEEQLQAYDTDSSQVVLVGNPSQGLTVFESPPVFEIFPQWNGQGLTALVRSYTYAAYSVNYGAAFCTIEDASTYGE